MSRKYVKITLILLILLINITTISLGQDKQEVEWIVASKFSSTSIQGQYYQRFADIVKELSDGRFIMEIFTSETLGGTDAVLDQLQNGDINLYPEGVGYLQRFNKSFAIFELPFIFDDADHWVNFFNSEMVDGWKENLSTNNLDVLGLQPLDPYRCLVTRKPVRSYDDFKGLKLRMFPNEVVISIWEHIGAQVIVLEWTDVYEGLRTGLVEGVTGGIAGIFDMSFHEPARFILQTNEYPQGVAWMMNKPGYESLSDTNKEILSEGYKQAAKWVEDNYAMATEEKIKKAIQEHNIQLLRINMLEFADKAWEYYPKLEEDGLVPEGTFEYIKEIR